MAVARGCTVVIAKSREREKERKGGGGKGVEGKREFIKV